MIIKRYKWKTSFEGFLIGLTIVYSLITIGMFWILFFTNHRGQEIAIFPIIAMLGLSGIYYWTERIWTKDCLITKVWDFKALGWSSLLRVESTNSRKI